MGYGFSGTDGDGTKGGSGGAPVAGSNPTRACFNEGVLTMKRPPDASAEGQEFERAANAVLSGLLGVLSGRSRRFRAECPLGV